MQRPFVIIRNTILIAGTLGVFGSLVELDHHLRFDPSRQAVRYLEARETEISSASAREAAGQGDLFLLEQLKLAGADLGAVDSDSGETPLLAALQAKEMEAVDYLLNLAEVATTINEPPKETSENALQWALNRNEFGLAERITALGASPDPVTKEGTTLLMRSLEERNWEVFSFLLSQGADANQTDKDGMTPLAISVDWQDGERIRALLDAAANVDINGIDGDPLLVEAINRGDHDLADSLLTAGAPVDGMGASGQTALLSAVKAGSTAMAELLLSHGADPNLVGQDKKTPLSIASEAGDVDLMQVLIDAGADARQPELIRTALRSRDLPSFHLLLNSGADPETSMGKRKKLLDEAITCGSLSMTRLLLESGADPKGHLWAALGAGDETLGEMLLFYGASASEKGPDGRLPIDFALETDSKTLMEALLEDGAIPNGKGSDGEYWVARAIREGNASAAETLIDHGACLDGIAAADGHSLLGWAIAHGMQGVIQRLIDQGADVRAREPSPASDAFTAAFTRSKTFRWHLQSDSKINPLMLAAAQGDTKTAKLLIDAGAQKGDYSKRYLWPVNIAAWHGDVAMMQIIFGRDPDPDRQPRRVIIDLSSQKATLYEDGRVAYSTRVSTGKPGYRTPSGVYVITDKHRHHTSSLYDASMPYFMRLSCAAFGLHQGYVPGYPASHGCIRVPESGARHLFGVCEVGDVVEIRQ